MARKSHAFLQLKPLKALTLINLDNNPILGLNSQFFADMPLLTSVSIYGASMFYLSNFNFTGTSISPVGAQLQLILYNNPIKAINSQLLNQLQARKSAGANGIYIYFKSIDGKVTNCVNPSATFANNLYIIGAYDLSYQNTTFKTSTTCYSDVTDFMNDAYNIGCGSC